MKNEEKTIEDVISKIDINSDEFKTLSKIDGFLESIKKKYLVSDDEKNIIDGEMTLYIVKENNENELVNNLKQHLSLSTKESVVEELIKETILFLKNKKNIPEAVAPSPEQALINIKERLNSPSVITQTKRDYSLEKEGGATLTKDIEKPKIDPYRELPSE
jgi:hypothetical protein